jgi:hypothetical protein
MDHPPPCPSPASGEREGEFRARSDVASPPAGSRHAAIEIDQHLLTHARIGVASDILPGRGHRVPIRVGAVGGDMMARAMMPVISVAGECARGKTRHQYDGGGRDEHLGDCAGHCVPPELRRLAILRDREAKRVIRTEAVREITGKRQFRRKIFIPAPRIEFRFPIGAP